MTRFESGVQVEIDVEIIGGWASCDNKTEAFKHVALSDDEGKEVLTRMSGNTCKLPGWWS